MIDLAPNLELEDSAARKVFSFVAMREAGKTWAASILAEQMIKAGIPVVVIDPMGVWWGLKLPADLNPRKKGLPVVVFGGEHQDLPLVPENAVKIANAIMKSNINAVFDTSELSDQEARNFVQNFLNELRQHNVHDRMIFLEEADIYAPQSPMPNENMVLNAVKKFISKGGNRNLGVTMLTQRSASLAKSVLTQSDFLVVMRTNAPQDKEAVKEWAMRRTNKKEQVNAWLDSLSDLKNGEAYVWGPQNNVPGLRVKFGARETFHATRENLKLLEKVQIEPMDVSEFLERYEHAFDPKSPKKVEIPKQKKPIMKYYPNLLEQPDPYVQAAKERLTPQVAETQIPEVLHIDDRKLVCEIHDLGPTVYRVDTSTFEGRVIYTLSNILKRRFARPKEIAEAALEVRGWNIDTRNFARDIDKALKAGVLIPGASANYGFPREIKLVNGEIAVEAL